MSPAQPPQAAAGNAVITFYRTSFVDGDIAQAPIVEKAGDSIKLVGIASSGTKIQYEVAPGEHSFVVGGQSSHYLKANVQAGKSLLRPRRDQDGDREGALQAPRSEGRRASRRY